MKKLMAAWGVLTVARITLGLTLMTSQGCGGESRPIEAPASPRSTGGTEQHDDQASHVSSPTSSTQTTSAVVAHAVTESSGPVPTGEPGSGAPVVVTTGGPGAPIETREPVSDADLKITAAIRRSVVSDRALSADARNVSIATAGGNVTLRGSVKDETERATIWAKAKQIAGVGEVVDRLEIRSK